MQKKTPRKYQVYLPVAFAVVLAFGMLLGARFNGDSLSKGKHIFFFQSDRPNKLNEVLRLINERYVDTVNLSAIEDESVREILAGLDPHSTYIEARELQGVNESLEGNFDGIGVEFYLLNDTIHIVSAIPGGPSEALGIRSGDKIIKIENEVVAGKKLQNTDVISRLRGPSGTRVKISIQRRGTKKLIDYTITRGKIPVNTVDVAYMLNQETGYIKITTFGATTHQEFVDEFQKLRRLGLKKLVLDLRGNPGGYLKTATEIADEILPDNMLIVYTEGKALPRTDEYATEGGLFEKGSLVILIDEGSASASEIVAGAVQDWDRGTIIGRRSFGKGLVQEQALFPDGSALRLTVARYYTPSGRSIQRPYDKGLEDYKNDFMRRFQHGELLHADSNLFNDSLKYKTASGRIVYGGGGIMPDMFVALDTSSYSPYYNEVISRGLISEFAYEYADVNKDVLNYFSGAGDFKANFVISESLFNRFIAYCAKKGVNPNTKDLRISKRIIKLQLKALMGRQLWQNDGYYRVLHEDDKVIAKALEILNALNH